MDWYDSRADCEKMNGTLVTIKDDLDHAAVTLQMAGEVDTWWMGLSRWDWTWSTG